MQKPNPTLLSKTEAPIDLDSWLTHFAPQYSIDPQSLIRRAVTLAQLTGVEKITPTGESCLQQGLRIAEVLTQLNVDPETLATGVLYSTVHYAELNIEDIEEQLDPSVAKLLAGVKKMDAMHSLHQEIGGSAIQSHTTDNLRKMLLAMVDDVRIVLIKLAERLVILRQMALLSDARKRQEAKITQEIYAPLANRLGIGHLKWELEDLSFRYLMPDAYKNISKLLKSTRAEREAYVQNVITLLKNAIHDIGIEQGDVQGRAKHIYSIYRKMQRKDVDIAEIYDAIAFRILVPTISDCYNVLGHIHSLWVPIRKEFDDYISQPKANGYRSIHTAVIGPYDNPIEIQLRTFKMHEEAELGVAAHWIYKEGRPLKTGYEAKIAWLRQVMAWQKEVSQTNETQELSEQPYSHIFDDRVYVFTPHGDIIELSKGATPLDFAYHIHSEIGHRCRGAKINGQIVPLTHSLQTGECVEILTAKEGHPSRDWLSPHLGYLKTSRAKAKVHHWFRQQNQEKNRSDGQIILEKEIRRLSLKGVNYSDLAHKLHQTNVDDFFAAIGRGDISVGNLSHSLQEILSAQTAHKVTTEPVLIPTPGQRAAAGISKDIEVQGVGNLWTHIALCCKPVPGDTVVGYITQGHGVSIHRHDCSNILNVSDQQKQRLIQVGWGTKTQEKYAVDLIIHAYDRPGLLRDITQLLVNEHLSILKLNCAPDEKTHTVHFSLSIEVNGLQPLSRILARIAQVPNVTEAVRV